MSILDIFRKGVDKKPIFVTYAGAGASMKPISNQALYYGIVFSCVDALANAVSAVEYGLFKKDARGELNRVEVKHDAYRLLERPNDFMTGADLLYLMSANIDTHGASYLYLVRSGSGKIAEIWPLPAGKVSVVRGENYVEGYTFTNPKGQRIPFTTQEVVEIKRPNPYDLYQGISTIEMARHVQENDYYQIEWNKKFFAQGAQPSGVLTTPQVIDITTFTMIKDEWRRNYEGVDNAHKTAILSGGMDFKAITPKQKDMDYLEGRRFNRDEILSIFKTPKTIVAITDDVNRANAETSEYVYAKRVVVPRLNLIFEKLNKFYLPLFAGSEGLQLGFESPVPEDAAHSLLRKSTAVNKWLTVNEVRAEDGYEPVEGGDVLYDAGGFPVGQDVDTEPKKAIEKLYKRMTKKDRELHQKRTRYLRKTEKEYRGKLGIHYRSLLKDIRRKKAGEGFDMKKKGLTLSEIAQELMPDLTEWKRLLVRINIDFGLAALKQSIKDTGETYELPHDFDLEHSGAIAWLKNEATEAADSVVETTRERIREIIARNLEEEDGTSLDEIREDVYDTLGQEEDFRIDRIARTELISAYNQGSYQEYRSSGVVEKIKWITADDEMVCSECGGNDGEIISFDDDFSSGDNQPPAHPNCRCSIVPVFD